MSSSDSRNEQPINTGISSTAHKFAVKLSSFRSRFRHLSESLVSSVTHDIAIIATSGMLTTHKHTE